MKKISLVLSTSILLAVSLTGCASESSNQPSPSPTATTAGPVEPLGPAQSIPSGAVLATPTAVATAPSKAEQVTVKAEQDKAKSDQLETLAKAADEKLAKAPAGSADAARAAEEAQALNQSAVAARIVADHAAAEAEAAKTK